MSRHWIDVGGERYDVPPGWTMMSEDEATRARDALRLLSDLDRCVHGRHSQDGCYGCQAISTCNNLGNPHLGPGVRVGTDISGRPIVVPEPGNLTDPSAWTSRGEGTSNG